MQSDTFQYSLNHANFDTQKWRVVVNELWKFIYNDFILVYEFICDYDIENFRKLFQRHFVLYYIIANKLNIISQRINYKSVYLSIHFLVEEWKIFD